MLRCRMLRHGAHQVNRPSLSGSSVRPTSTRPLPMIRSRIARSSGSWPMARGFRSFGCTSRSVRATFRSPHSTSGPSGSPAARGVGVHRLEELHLGGEVLAAVRHVDRRDGHAAADLGGDDPVLVVERGVGKRRPLGRERLADVQGDAGVALVAVPVAPVALHLAESGRHLIGCGLDLLQADDVRSLARDPLLHLRLPRADAVDVPGGDLQETSESVERHS